MHYFPLKDIQHFILYFFPAFISVLLIGVGLAFSHFKTKTSEPDKSDPHHTFIDGIEDRNGPFPLVLILVIVGTVMWAFFYILFIGLSGVKI